MISKVIARAKARGLPEVGRTAFDRLREEVFSDNLLIVMTRGTGGDSETFPGIELQQATAFDAPAYERDIGTDSAKTFRARLSEETQCYLAKSERRILHASWVTTEAVWTREVRRYFKPPRGDAYLFASFTRPEARGRGIYPFVLRALSVRLEARSIARIWIGVIGDNPASFKAVRKAGFSEAFRTPYRRRLGVLVLEPATGPLAHLAPYCLVRRAARPGATRAERA